MLAAGDDLLVRFSAHVKVRYDSTVGEESAQETAPSVVANAKQVRRRDVSLLCQRNCFLTSQEFHRSSGLLPHGLPSGFWRRPPLLELLCTAVHVQFNVGRRYRRSAAKGTIY